ncbi:MAG: acyl-CoA/acyl-ACP dehydrogenase [Actinobacteria bacterium]|nr:acyl-CoA/acyl-ACP dehydrogenase [Actinomycetota bacterium]
MATEIGARTRPAPLRSGDDEFVALATELGEQIAGNAANHDRDNTWVDAEYKLLEDAGYLRLAVPEELGGLGATIRQVCYAQAELARHCGSTALAANMHLYITLMQCFRRRNGAPDAEGILRRVAEEGLVLMTSGGSDWLWSTGEAVRDNGGFRVSGRKRFCSQAPRANVLATSAVYEDPEQGRQVIMFSVPMTEPGVQIIETWDTMGMRGTSSHDVELTDVYVPEERVVARREWGRLDPALTAAGIHIAPTAAAVYYGIAHGARDDAVDWAMTNRRGETPVYEIQSIQRLVGLMDAKLRTSWWALVGSLDEIGDDFGPDAGTLTTVMLAKRMVVTEAVAVVDAAMELVGGGAFFKRMPFERAYRDVRAGQFHPFTPETTLFYAGRLALGGDTSVE